ncbi:MAG: amidohydrolase family protein, partial [Stellaceae bacterium]
MIDLNSIVAIDVHTHADGPPGSPSYEDGAEGRAFMAKYFKTTYEPKPIKEIAQYYRERKTAAVIFTVDAEAATGRRRYPNEEVARQVAENDDILIPFASIDPHKGKLGVREARDLIKNYGVKGFKFHPSSQAFYPNDRMAYGLYEVIAEHKLIALFHTGQTGVGSGMRGGGGIKLEYSNPMYLDEVAVEFPDMSIIMAHPSFPWQEQALSVCQHKPNVYID